MSEGIASHRSFSPTQRIGCKSLPWSVVYTYKCSKPSYVTSERDEGGLKGHRSQAVLRLTYRQVQIPNVDTPDQAW